MTRRALKIAEAAAELGVHPETIRLALARGELPGRRLGRQWLIPIDAQLLLCGTHFGLPLIKHRLFEANWPLPMAPASCDHRDVYNPWSGEGRSAAKLREAQGTPWIPMSGGASRKAGVTGDLFNAIPPAYTEHVGAALLAYLQERAVA